MKDYYAILGITPQASRNDIRRAYRSQAKKIHPDRSGQQGTARFLALKEAYEVLSSQTTRNAYDLVRGPRSETESGWDYRSFLHSRKDDPESLTRLICYDLLHDFEDEAVQLYDAAGTGGLFTLRCHLDREDFMDYTFLLAETYLEQEAVVKAWRLLRGIAELEEEDPYFRHFYVEVLERMAAIVRHPLPEDSDNLLRIAFLKDLVTLAYTSREKARLYQLTGELLSASERYEEAAACMVKAYELSPKLPGLAGTIKTLKEMGLA